MTLDLTVAEVLALSRVGVIAIERCSAEVRDDPDVDADALLSAAEKLHRAATAFVAQVSAPGTA